MALDDFFFSEFTVQTSIYFPARKLVLLASPSPDKSFNCLPGARCDEGSLPGSQCPTGYSYYLRLAKDFAFIMLRVQLITTGLNVKSSEETRHGCHSSKRILTGHDV